MTRIKLLVQSALFGVALAFAFAVGAGYVHAANVKPLVICPTTGVQCQKQAADSLWDGTNPFGLVTTAAQYQTSVFGDATHVHGVGPGTSGQCFMSNGAASDPSFQPCAGGSGGGLTLIQTVTVSGSSTTQITFGSYTATGKHLRVVIVGRTLATDSAIGNVGLILNGDTTAAHYPSATYWFSGGAGTLASSSAYGGFAGGAFPTSASSNTVGGIVDIDIYNASVSSPSFEWSAMNAGVTTGRTQVWTQSAYEPASSTTITSVTITAVNNSLAVTDFASGTVGYLYSW